MLTLVCLALLYGVVVAPSGEDPRLTEYQMKHRAEKHIGLYEPNALLDTGQVYPPPRKVQPTVTPFLKRRRRKHRRRVKYDKQKILPDIIKEHLDALEHGDNVKVMPDEVIRQRNAKMNYMNIKQMDGDRENRPNKLREFNKV